MHIACAVDDAYVAPLCGMLSSVFAHHRGPALVIHVVTDGLASAGRERLEGFICCHGAEVRFHAIPPGYFCQQQLIIGHFSAANFFRLLLPELMADVARVLYLDADILVRRSLEPFYSVDLQGNPVAATPDAWPEESCRRLGLPEAGNYFNSGVLLMDLAAWRREGIGATAAAYLAAHNGDPERTRYADQDALNVVLQGRWRRMSETWNLSVTKCRQFPARMTAEQRAILVEGPAVVHFANYRKPWLRGYVLPFQPEFLRNARHRGVTFSSPRFPEGWRAYFRELRFGIKLWQSYRKAGLPTECFR